MAIYRSCIGKKRGGVHAVHLISYFHINGLDLNARLGAGRKHWLIRLGAAHWGVFPFRGITGQASVAGVFRDCKCFPLTQEDPWIRRLAFVVAVLRHRTGK